MALRDNHRTQTEDDHDRQGQDSTPQGVTAGVGRRPLQCQPRLQADGLFPPAILRDPAQLSDLRESGSLEQDADNVYFLVRLDQYGIFEYNEAYDNILPAGTHSTAGKILVYSRKFRSDSQFGLMLDFVNGHILDGQSELTQFQIDPIEQSRIIEAARPSGKDDIPF